MNPIKNEYKMFHRHLKRPLSLGTKNVDKNEEETSGKHAEIKDASLDDQNAAEEELNKETNVVISKSPQGNAFI